MSFLILGNIFGTNHALQNAFKITPTPFFLCPFPIRSERNQATEPISYNFQTIQTITNLFVKLFVKLKHCE